MHPLIIIGLVYGSMIAAFLAGILLAGRGDKHNRTNE